MKILKESLFSTDSELVSYDEMDVDAVADPTYVDAIDNRQKTIKELNKRFRDKEKERDDFVKQNHNTNFKPKTDKELKKLKLSESLFEANDVKAQVTDFVYNLINGTLDNLSQVVASNISGYNADWCDSDGQTAVANKLAQNIDSVVNAIVAVLFSNSGELNEATEYTDPEAMGRGTCAPLVFDSTRRIQQNLKYLNNEDERMRSVAKKDLQVCIEDLEDQRQTVENFNTYWTTRYKASLNFIQAQLNLIPSELFNESLEEASAGIHLDGNNLDTIEEIACEIAKQDCDMFYVKKWVKQVNPNIKIDDLIIAVEQSDFAREIKGLIAYMRARGYKTFGEFANALTEALSSDDSLEEFVSSEKPSVSTFSVVKEDTAVLDKPETDIEVDFTPKDDTIYYKTKRQPLADIIMRELTSGEVVYKMGDSGKLNATHAPGLNLDEEDIGAKDDENGYYIIAWVATEGETKAVEAIANKFKRPFKTGYSKYAGEKPYFTKIYIEEKDWDEPYFDPDVPLRPSTKKRK